MLSPVAAPGALSTTWLPGAQRDPGRVGPTQGHGQPVAGRRARRARQRHRHGVAVDGEEVRPARSRRSSGAGDATRVPGMPSSAMPRGSEIGGGCLERVARGRLEPHPGHGDGEVRPFTAGNVTGTAHRGALAACRRRPGGSSRRLAGESAGTAPSAASRSQAGCAAPWAPSECRRPPPRRSRWSTSTLPGTVHLDPRPASGCRPEARRPHRGRVAVEGRRRRGAEVTGQPLRGVGHHPARRRHRAARRAASMVWSRRRRAEAGRARQGEGAGGGEREAYGPGPARDPRREPPGPRAAAS